MIFADASALLAMVANEPEALAFADILDTDDTRTCSALSVWETIAGLCRSHTFSVASARARVHLFLDALNFRFVNIGELEYGIATEAYAQFGRGRHPAKLNMGDCYAYACAKANGAKLLFKGDDFAKTDIASAMQPGAE
ncbi:MAG: type II toxin-antitoxin system VapC family toxin [Acetobacteraceae bacterium]